MTFQTSAAKLKDKRVGVVGLARTGVATARFCLDQGAAVTLFERNPESIDPAVINELKALGADMAFDGPDRDRLSGVDLVVPSPGVPPDSQVLSTAKRDGVPVISEIELASRYTDRTLIAVTGTNGKTTTVTLIGEILKAAGMEPDVAGNIGRPLIEAIARARRGPLVVETSSFQLEYTRDFRPHIAVLLNLEPDHADWHDGFENYRRSKLKIFQAQQPSDWAVVNRDFAALTDGTEGRLVEFGGSTGVFLRDGWICQDFLAGKQKIVPIDSLFIRGPHNYENIMAAVAVGLICGIAAEVIAQVTADFRGVEHRLEFVNERRGVKFFNDSKATNPAAAVKAIETFDGGLILLAGGRNKGNAFDELAEAARGRVKLAVLFGEAADDIEQAFKRRDIPTERSGSLAAAMSAASVAAVAGDVVLLSPACASFDMFRDYEDRGRVFKELVEMEVSAVGRA
jgi:UDP-N-acetylmuramoylalanine--D-glutamate ligase